VPDADHGREVEHMGIVVADVVERATGAQVARQ
jgi:hypothetical protein